MKLILLGAPGSGKGTQADIICQQLSIPAISTGNIIREAMASGSPMGLEAKAYVDDGKLVPDAVVIGIIQERLAQPDCQNGFILDGFPRTVPQAEALDAMGIVIDKVIGIELADVEIERRLTGRRVCNSCGASYHVLHNPPTVEGVCDKCGADLVTRKDDQPETVRERLHVYHMQTEPLKAYYTRQGKLRIVYSQEKLEDTTRLTQAALES